MSREDAAEYLGISARELSNLKAAGKIKSVVHHLSTRPKYRRSELDDYIEELEYADGHCVATQGPKGA
jgi:predicted site-specific integrase-resolvase